MGWWEEDGIHVHMLEKYNTTQHNTTQHNTTNKQSKQKTNTRLMQDQDELRRQQLVVLKHEVDAQGQHTVLALKQLCEFAMFADGKSVESFEC